MKTFKRLTIILHGEWDSKYIKTLATKMAQILPLTGYVREVSSGHIEIIAEGREGDLDLYFAQLEKGTAWARVTKAEKTWASPTGEFSDFSAR